MIFMAKLKNWFGGIFGDKEDRYREAQSANAISKEINRYLMFHGLVDSDGFYYSDTVSGAFDFDLSSFSPFAVRRILNRISNAPINTRVSLVYNPSEKAILFTLKFR